jgi:hypothetical protein
MAFSVSMVIKVMLFLPIMIILANFISFIISIIPALQSFTGIGLSDTDLQP